MSVAVAPAPSVAVTVMTLVPTCKATDGIDHEVVPVAVPLPRRSLTHETELTLVSSLAVPLRAIVLLPVENVGFAVGDEIWTVGAGFGGGVVLAAVQFTVDVPEQPHTNGIKVYDNCKLPWAAVDDVKAPLT